MHIQRRTTTRRKATVLFVVLLLALVVPAVLLWQQLVTPSAARGGGVNHVASAEVLAAAPGDIPVDVPITAPAGNRVADSNLPETDDPPPPIPPHAPGVGRLIICDHEGEPVHAELFLWSNYYRPDAAIRVLPVPPTGVPLTVLDGVSSAFGRTDAGGLFVVGGAKWSIRDSIDRANDDANPPTESCTIAAAPPGFGWFSPVLAARWSDPALAREFEPLIVEQLATCDAEEQLLRGDQDLIEATLTATAPWIRPYFFGDFKGEMSALAEKWNLPATIEGRISSDPVGTPFIVLTRMPFRPDFSRRSSYWYSYIGADSCTVWMPAMTSIVSNDGLGWTWLDESPWDQYRMRSRLVPSGPVRIVIVDQHGLPVPYALIYLDTDNEYGAAFTDSDGRLFLGAIQVGAEPVELSLEFEVDEGNPYPTAVADPWVTIRVSPTPHAVTEVAVAVERLPMMRLTIDDPANRLEPGRADLWFIVDGKIQDRSFRWIPDADGAMWRPTPLEPFELAIETDRHGEQHFGPWHLDSRDEHARTITLAVPPADAVIRVTPLRWAVGADYRLGRLTAFGERWPRRSGVVPADGRVELMDLRAGEYRLTVTPQPVMGEPTDPGMCAQTSTTFTVDGAGSPLAEMSLLLERGAMIVIAPHEQMLPTLVLTKDGQRIELEGRNRPQVVAVNPGAVVVALWMDSKSRDETTQAEPPVVFTGEAEVGKVLRVDLSVVRCYRITPPPVGSEAGGDSGLWQRLESHRGGEQAWTLVSGHGRHTNWEPGPLPPGRYRMVHLGDEPPFEFTLPDDADDEGTIAWPSDHSPDD